MNLLTEEQRAKMLANGKASAGNPNTDHVPVVKLFTPDAECTWLLSELDPGDPDIAFGLCDLGVGFPELGTVRISELQRVRGILGLSVERDLHFHTEKPMSVYAEEARRLGRIRT